MKIEFDCTQEQFDDMTKGSGVMIFEDVEGMPPVVILRRDHFLKLINKLGGELKLQNTIGYPGQN